MADTSVLEATDALRALNFVAPLIADNPDGWGPTTVPEQYKNIPYAPFNKGDKVGKAADWTGQGFKYGQGRYERERGGVNAAFNFFANEDEDFQLVDTKPTPKVKYGVRRFQQNRFNQQRQFQDSRRDVGRDSGAGADRERQRRERVQLQKRNQRNTYDNRPATRIVYNSSVDIKPEWVVLEQLPLSAFTKLNFDAGEPQDLVTCGSLYYYDKSYDRLTPKMEKPLQRSEQRLVSQCTAADDPIIRRLSQAGAARVFTSDRLLSTLMCAPRSVYSWDILAHRLPGGALLLDQRVPAPDMLTVNETAVPAELAGEEGLNSVQSLSHEATFLNQSFAKQVLLRGGPKHDFKEPSPFEDSTPVAYRYRKWKLDDEVSVVVRCTLDSVMELRGEEVYATVHALNEFDPKLTGVDWRQKIENQRGAVLAAELKNNANKLAKWTAQALLAGAEVMKLGFVSRAHPRDVSNHVVLAVQAYKPREFAAQITLGVNNMWGIVKAVVDMCMKLDEGKYLFVKDPNKPIVRLYAVPKDSFDNDYAEEPIPEQEKAAAEASERPQQEAS